MFNYCSLSAPPGARVKAQMKTTECKRKRAINRIKTYRIFKSVLPITMLHHADDIVRTCAALCLHHLSVLPRIKEKSFRSLKKKTVIVITTYGY